MEWIGAGVIITMLVHLGTVVHYFGRISGKLDSMSYRVERIEGYVDKWITRASSEPFRKYPGGASG